MEYYSGNADPTIEIEIPKEISYWIEIIKNYLYTSTCNEPILRKIILFIMYHLVNKELSTKIIELYINILKSCQLNEVCNSDGELEGERPEEGIGIGKYIYDFLFPRLIPGHHFNNVFIMITLLIENKFSPNMRPEFYTTHILGLIQYLINHYVIFYSVSPGQQIPNFYLLLHHGEPTLVFFYRIIMNYIKKNDLKLTYEGFFQTLGNAAIDSNITMSLLCVFVPHMDNIGSLLLNMLPYLKPITNKEYSSKLLELFKLFIIHLGYIEGTKIKYISEKAQDTLLKLLPDASVAAQKQLETQASQKQLETQAAFAAFAAHGVQPALDGQAALVAVAAQATQEQQARQAEVAQKIRQEADAQHAKVEQQVAQARQEQEAALEVLRQVAEQELTNAQQAGQTAIAELGRLAEQVALAVQGNQAALQLLTELGAHGNVDGIQALTVAAAQGDAAAIQTLAAQNIVPAITAIAAQKKIEELQALVARGLQATIETLAGQDVQAALAAQAAQEKLSALEGLLAGQAELGRLLFTIGPPAELAEQFSLAVQQFALAAQGDAAAIEILAGQDIQEALAVQAEQNREKQVLLQQLLLLSEKEDGDDEAQEKHLAQAQRALQAAQAELGTLAQQAIGENRDPAAIQTLTAAAQGNAAAIQTLAAHGVQPALAVQAVIALQAAQAELGTLAQQAIGENRDPAAIQTLMAAARGNAAAIQTLAAHGVQPALAAQVAVATLTAQLINAQQQKLLQKIEHIISSSGTLNAYLSPYSLYRSIEDEQRGHEENQQLVALVTQAEQGHAAAITTLAGKIEERNIAALATLSALKNPTAKAAIHVIETQAAQGNLVSQDLQAKLVEPVSASAFGTFFSILKRLVKLLIKAQLESSTIYYTTHEDEKTGIFYYGVMHTLDILLVLLKCFIENLSIDFPIEIVENLKMDTLPNNEHNITFKISQELLKLYIETLDIDTKKREFIRHSIMIGGEDAQGEQTFDMANYCYFLLDSELLTMHLIEANQLDVNFKSALSNTLLRNIQNLTGFLINGEIILNDSDILKCILSLKTITLLLKVDFRYPADLRASIIYFLQRKSKLSLTW
jgi:hypothetical protein